MTFMKRMSLRNKLNSLTGIVIAGLCLLAAIVLVGERNQLLADRYDKVRNLVH